MNKTKLTLFIEINKNVHKSKYTFWQIGKLTVGALILNTKQ